MNRKSASGPKQGKRTSRRGAAQRTKGLRRRRTPFEWGLLAVSLTSIGAVLLGLLLYAGGSAGDQAELRAEAEVSERLVSGEPEVVVTLTNSGGSAAEEVVLEVRWGGETREITFARVGKDEEITGSVIFPAGASGSPEASVLSYNHP